MLKKKNEGLTLFRETEGERQYPLKLFLYFSLDSLNIVALVNSERKRFSQTQQLNFKHEIILKGHGKRLN